jgi:hypothetical protein
VSTTRSRLSYAVLACATIAVGLLVHLYGAGLGPKSRDVLGDVLWAAMIVWWLGVLAPRASLRNRAIAALAICVAVELSQLYRSPMVDALRATMLGELALGSGFDPRDLAAYAAGVLAAVVVERIALRCAAVQVAAVERPKRSPRRRGG